MSALGTKVNESFFISQPKYFPPSGYLSVCLFATFRSPGVDSENLDFSAPLEEHKFYGLFCFFGSTDFILKTLPYILKSVRKTL